MLTQVRNRLQLKYPDQQADQPHNPDQVLSAAEYVLTGAIVNTPADATPAPPTQTSRAPSGSDLKMEDLAPFLKLLIRSAGEAPPNPAALTSAQRAAAGAPQAQLAPQAYDYRNANPTNTAYCHYCGDAGCQIRFCRHVEEDMKQGKIARNQEGKIVLANGAFVPRNIPGITMREDVGQILHCIEPVLLCFRVGAFHRCSPPCRRQKKENKPVGARDVQLGPRRRRTVLCCIPAGLVCRPVGRLIAVPPLPPTQGERMCVVE